MKRTAVASPHHSARPEGVTPRVIVLHADAATDAKASVSWIKAKESKVSYHALVDRDGTVYTFVDPSRKAWHCGVSEYQGVQNVNDYSLGLSFANVCDGVEPYTDAQYTAGADVVRDWMALYPTLSVEHITTHEATALPAGRKHDPGPLFDFARFAALCYDAPGIT